MFDTGYLAFEICVIWNVMLSDLKSCKAGAKFKRAAVPASIQAWWRKGESSFRRITQTTYTVCNMMQTSVLFLSINHS